MVTVKDISELSYFQNLGMTLLGGKTGLSREASTVNMIQLFTFDQWMKGGEILLVNGIGLHLDKPENISRIIDKAYTKNVACIIFMQNHFLSHIPNEAVEQADMIGFPIFWIPSEPPFSECISVIYHFVSAKESEEKMVANLTRNLLLYDNETDAALLLQQLHDLQCTYPGCRSIVFKSDDNISSSGSHIYHDIYKQIVSELNETMLLYLINERQLTVLLPLVEASDVDRLVDKTLKSISSIYPNVHLKIGCGRYYTKPEDYKKSYQEACHCHKACPDNTTTYLLYENLGLLKLCIDTSYPEYILQYIQNNLKPVIDYDRQNNSDLIKTLDILVKTNFNVTHAAQLLYVHRNTMIQRIGRLQNLLGVDFEDYKVRMELSVALYLNQYYQVQNVL